MLTFLEVVDMTSLRRSNRRIILDLTVTLDGFIEEQDGEMDWCIMNPDMLRKLD